MDEKAEMEKRIEERVFVSLSSGALFVGVPLYQRFKLICGGGFKIFLDHSDVRPICYAIDIGRERFTFMNAEFIESKSECLGDL